MRAGKKNHKKDWMINGIFSEDRAFFAVTPLFWAVACQMGYFKKLILKKLRWYKNRAIILLLFDLSMISKETISPRWSRTAWRRQPWKSGASFKAVYALLRRSENLHVFVMGNSMRFCLKIDPKSNGWKQTIWFVTMANLVDSFFLPTLLAFILHAQGKKNPHHFIDGQINLFLWGVLLHIFNRLPMFPKGAIKMGLVNDQQILLNKRLVLLAKNGAIILACLTKGTGSTRKSETACSECIFGHPLLNFFKRLEKTNGKFSCYLKLLVP